jgi:hypothetical protein
MPAMFFQKRLFQVVLAIDLVGLCLGAIVERVADLPGLEYDFIVVGGVFIPLPMYQGLTSVLRWNGWPSCCQPAYGEP